VTLTSANGYAASTTRAVGTNASEVVATSATGTDGFLASNYDITYVSGSLSITARPINITATSGQTKIYGDADPVLTYAVEANGSGRGLFNNDTFSGALSRASGENVGSTYAITQGTLNNTNYDITLVSNNFAITPRPISLAVDAKAKTYGSNDPTFTATITSGSLATVAVNDSLADITGTMTRAAGNNVGQYAIALGLGSKASNYDITYAANNLTINKARLRVVGSKAYNGQIEFEAANLTVTGENNETFVVTGNATMQSKHVQTEQALANVVGLTISNGNNSSLSNYESLAVGDTKVSVTPRVVDFTAPTINKVYDGGYTYTVTSGNARDAQGNCMSDLCRMSQNLVGGDQVTNATIIFAGNDKNVGTGKLVNVTEVTINDGNNGNNYVINRTNGLIASSSNSNITQAPLTVQAVNDARLYGQADSSNFGGAIINGFVGGESFGTLGSTLTIQRSNATVNDAGTYTGVLVPSITSNTENNLALGNYSISRRNGDYTIVPAQTLLVKVSQSQATTYGDTPAYNITAQYLSSGRAVINCTGSSSCSGPTTNNGGPITISDVPNGSSASFAAFTIGVQASATDYSSAGSLSVGGYNLTSTDVTTFGNNFRALTLVGSLTIKPKEISASSLGIQSVTKVYDGTTNINNDSIIDVNRAQSQVRAGDQVAISATGLFANKNVGVNKSVTIDVSLSGLDAKNYTLPIDSQTQQSNGRFVNNIGTITQLDSVSWVGDNNDGRWSNSSNWTNGALPDGNNVRTVNIGAGKNVIFDSALVGQVDSNIVNNGSIIFNGANDFTFNSNVSGTGSISHSNVGVLTLSGNNEFTGGTYVAGTSKLVVASSTGLGSGTLNVNGGYLTIQPGITLSGNLTVNGAINLMSDVFTTGSQTYNGSVSIHGGVDEAIDIFSVRTLFDNLKNTYSAPETFISGTEVVKVRRIGSTNGLINFNGQVKAVDNDETKKISLYVDAPDVTINQNIGGDLESITSANAYLSKKFGPNDEYFYDLKINQLPKVSETSPVIREFYPVNLLGTIRINADILTAGSQRYGSAVIVGDNGTNGLTRSLISLDPSITFASTVDDAVEGRHTLISKAISNSLPSANDPKPFVDYQDIVGGAKKLLSVETLIGVRNPIDIAGKVEVDPDPFRRSGTLMIQDTIATTGNQTHSASSLVLGDGTANQTMFITSDTGNVVFNIAPPVSDGGVYARSGSLIVRDDTPGGSITGLLGQGNGEFKSSTQPVAYERPVATDTSSFNLLANIKNSLSDRPSDLDLNDGVVGSVDVGNMEDAGDAAKCDVKTDDNCKLPI
ncbi:S-layer family protein, partial [Polynucleobacter sp. AM-26B4]|uniref:beta strand repeat-containing protein n=1 Tax=Polynucleobacter sp. AM-26B4 TaxID=2689103 RepID=UPI001C0BD37B